MYYVNLKNRNDRSVGKIALKLHSQAPNSWFHFASHVVKSLDFDLHKLNKSTVKNAILPKLKNMCHHMYTNKIAENGKLELYKDIKVNLNREKYLKCMNPDVRKIITESRISCHKLPIELGRHKNVNREDRLCKFCNNNIGDEQHLFMFCFHPVLTNIRNMFLSKIITINPSLKVFDRKSLFKYIMSLKDDNILDDSINYIYRTSCEINKNNKTL